MATRYRPGGLLTATLSILALIVSGCGPAASSHASTSTTLVGFDTVNRSITGAPSEGSVTSRSPAPRTEAPNRKLAVAESRRLVKRFPIPSASAKVTSVPPRDLGHLGVHAGYVDPSLTRTRWWIVPISYRRLEGWYAANTPADTGSAFYEDGTLSPNGDLFWTSHVTSKAYSTPVLVASYSRLGPHKTALRTDVTLAARYDRVAETLAPAGVTSIDISKWAIDGPSQEPVTATVTDPTALSTLVAAFNHLPGAYAGALPLGCGSPAGIVYVYAVTLHWPGHTLAVDPGAELCGIGRGLTLDGVRLPTTLQNQDRFEALLRRLLSSS